MKSTPAAATCACAFVLASCCFDYDKPRATASIRHTSTSISTKPAMTEAEKARASIAKQCALRHVDRGNGVLDETEVTKKEKDEICGAHYRGGG
jgi:hypothetical protein